MRVEEECREGGDDDKLVAEVYAVCRREGEGGQKAARSGREAGGSVQVVTEAVEGDGKG